jgi:hypothetical protein
MRLSHLQMYTHERKEKIKVSNQLNLCLFSLVINKTVFLNYIKDLGRIKKDQTFLIHSIRDNKKTKIQQMVFLRMGS